MGKYIAVTKGEYAESFCKNYLKRDAFTDYDFKVMDECWDKLCGENNFVLMKEGEANRYYSVDYVNKLLGQRTKIITVSIGNDSINKMKETVEELKNQLVEHAKSLRKSAMKVE